MAKNKARRRYFARIKRRVSRGKMTIPIAVVAGLMPGVSSVVSRGTSVGWQSAGQLATEIYTGYNPATGNFSVAAMRGGTMPLLAGFAIHKIAGMIGINRMLAAARVPLLRI